MIIAATDAAAQRKEAMAQGAYDGRFAPKIVGNKKDLMIGLVKLSDVKSCSDYELIC